MTMSQCSFTSVTGGVQVKPIHPQSVGSNKASRRNICGKNIGRSSLGSSNSCDHGNSGSVCSTNGSSNEKKGPPQHGQQVDKGRGGSKVSGGGSHNPQQCKAEEAATSWYGH